MATKSWFSYISGVTSLPSSYKFITINPDDACTDGNVICAIYAVISSSSSSSSKPIMSSSVLTAITNAINNHAGNALALLKA